MPLCISATGHRPAKLLGYSDEAHYKLTAFASRALITCGATSVVSGMALGWDIAIAQAALELKLPLTCAIPFANQPARWKLEQISRWYKIKSLATQSLIISSGEYSADKMQRRNEWMVDNSDAVLALWNGSNGGTFNCLQYAKRKQTPVINMWPEFIKEFK